MKIKIDHSILNDYVNNLLLKANIPSQHAKIMTDVLLYANLTGKESHGITRLIMYLDRLRNNMINPNPIIRIFKENGPSVMMDGDNGFGPIVGHYSMKEAIGRSRKYGVSLVTVNNSNHMGSLGYFSKQAIDQNVIGMVIQNTTPNMAPWGGINPTVGNNPFSIGIPSGDEIPIILDFACSTVAKGKIRIAAETNKKIDPSWALDATGKPTIDPKEALKGVVLPFGEHKGYGLAVVFGILAGILSNADYGKHVTSLFDHSQLCGVGHFFLAIDPEYFVGINNFKNNVDSYIRFIKSSKLKCKNEEVCMPGARSLQYLKNQLSSGIKIESVTLKKIEKLAEQFGIQDRLIK
jgi:LDH2 family malate/lactate/ureidoglycolate dehydrogenase